MEGLRQKGITVTHGAKGRWLTLVRTVRSQRPDFIHYDWINSYYLKKNLPLTCIASCLLLLEVWWVSVFTRTHIVWTLHNVYPHGSKQHALHRWYRGQLGRRCQWIRVFSEETAEKVRREFGVATTKMRVVPEGSYRAYYTNKVGKATARDTIGVPSATKVLLYLGLLHPYKGVADLVEAFLNIPAPYRKGWLLYIVGGVKSVEYLRSIEERSVGEAAIRIVPGFVEDDQLQHYYAVANVVVLPFRKVTNSGSVILAMGFGKPVVAPAFGVLPQRLKQQRELLYGPQETLSDVLMRVFTLPETALDRLGRANLAAVDRYNWTDFAVAFRSE